MSELTVGQTVELKDGRVAIIRFFGRTLFAPGEWLGVELYDASGKNDGSIEDQRYFDCELDYGMFVRPATVTRIVAPAPDSGPDPTAYPVGTAAPAASSRPVLAPAPRRPSSLHGPNLQRAAAYADPTLNRRISLNAASPSPGPRSARPPIVRLGAPAGLSSSSASTLGSAASTRKPPNSLPAKSRLSLSSSRLSMPPPPVPSPRISRPSLHLAATSRLGSMMSAKTAGTRLSYAGSGGGRAAVSTSSRPPLGGTDGSRVSEDLNADDDVTTRLGLAGQRSSDEVVDMLSPQPTNLTRPRTIVVDQIAAAAAAAVATATATATNVPEADRSTAKGQPTGRPPAREVEDLKAKIRVLERKRIEDRDRIKQLDRIQAERDKFETIIQKIEAKLQPHIQENQALKRALREAEGKLDELETIQAVHGTELEIATLDREMAEEQSENLKLELDSLRMKADELEMEVDVLRAENSELTDGMTAEEQASAGWMEMKKMNERLREALIRLNEISKEQEHEHREEIKAREQDLVEFGTVKEQHSALQGRTRELEAALDDVRQQLDDALGAEETIEQLSDQNAGLSEKIEELRATIDDLENLKEISDELELNYVQDAEEMQDELDFRDSVIAEQARRAGQQDEAVEDLEYTLSMFRDLVTNLQTDIEDMRASQTVTETESEKLHDRSRAMLDLNRKLRMSAAKAQVKAVDLELRRLDADEAEKHLAIVRLYLPDSFQDDKDSVLVLLRFHRLSFKAGLLQAFVRERIGSGPAHVGHEDDLLHGCAAVDRLGWVAAVCDRFGQEMGHCSTEQFARYRGALHELEPVERALNGWIDGLRRDELQEKRCADELQRMLSLLSHLAEVHAADGAQSYADETVMKAVVIQNHLESAAVSLSTIRAMVNRVLMAGEEKERTVDKKPRLKATRKQVEEEEEEAEEEDDQEEEEDEDEDENEAEEEETKQQEQEKEDEQHAAQHLNRRTDFAATQTRSSKVAVGKVIRALKELRSRSLALAPAESQAELDACEAGAGELADVARQIGLDLHGLLHEEGRREPVRHTEVQEAMRRRTSPRAGAVDDGEADVLGWYLSRLGAVAERVNRLASVCSDLGQTQEFECGPAPWQVRSTEAKSMQALPAAAEEEALRIRDELRGAHRRLRESAEAQGIAELQIETLQARMRDARTKAERLRELEARLDQAGQTARGLQDDRAQQDREIRALEADRDRWKKLAGDGRALAAGPHMASGPEHAASAVVAALELQAVRDNVAALQAAVRHLRDDNRRARTTEQADHDWLADPLLRPSQDRHRHRAGAEASRAARASATAESRDALAVLLHMAGSARLFDLTATTPPARPHRTGPQYQAARQMEDCAAWTDWRNEVVRRSDGLLAGAGPWRLRARGGRATDPKTRGRPTARLFIRLPGPDGKAVSGGASGPTVRVVEPDEWEGLHGRLAAL